MNIEIRALKAPHGWGWIVAGYAIFRRSPLQWIMLIAILFAGSRILRIAPLLGLLAILTAPHFYAGLAHGAQALERGKSLRLTYLLSGFLKNAGRLLTIGALSLLGHFLMLYLMIAIGGDEAANISKSVASGSATPESVEAMRAAMPNLLLGIAAGFLLSAPLMMAVWFAPLLIFFDDLKPSAALALSFKACLRNVLPFLVYGLAIFAPMLLLTQVSMAARQPDLALWLMGPVLLPSIYASYRDIFVNAKVETDEPRPQSVTP